LLLIKHRKKIVFHQIIVSYSYHFVLNILHVTYFVK